MSSRAPVTVGVLQSASRIGDVEENIRRISDAAGEARAQGADVLLTPELFTTGYAPGELAGVTARDARVIVDSCAAIAQRHGIALVASSPHVDAEGRRFIGACFFDASGEVLLEYRKTHLWGEDENAVFSSCTEAPRVTAWRGRTIGIEICFDIEFPETTRHLAREGAEIVFVPTALGVGGEYVSELLVPARAAENNVTIVFANHLDPETALVGRSRIAGPGGIQPLRMEQRAGVEVARIQDAEKAGWSAPDYLSHARFDAYARWDQASRERSSRATIR